ncbi:MAG: 30S ribosomal protein S6 [Candidatus Zixiibacteriota bacterium]
MRTYDTTFIVNPQTDDASIDRDVRAVADLITTNGGKIVKEDRMGTRRLAYPIKRLTQGHYTSFIYEAKSHVPKLLDRHFRLGEAYLRYLTILYEGEVRTDEEEGEGRAKAEPAQVKEAVEETAESEDEAAKDEKPEADAAEAELAEEKKPVAEAPEAEPAKPPEFMEAEYPEEDEL